MKVAILGGGGVGGCLAARLALAGREVHLIARGAHLGAMVKGGLELYAPDGDFCVPGRSLNVTGNARDVGPADLLVVAVKAYELERAIDSAKGAIGPRTAILPLQNGVDAAERIRARVEGAAVLGGVARIVASLAGPGVVEVATPLHLTVGALSPGHDALAAEVAEALSVPGVTAARAEDIRVQIWTKFLFICGFSGMTCLCRTPIAPVLAHPESRAMLEATMREVEAIARARGVPLEPGVVAAQLDSAAHMPPTSPSSMLGDLERGRRLELDALHGAAVRLGREVGVPTPANSAILAALRPWADGRPSLAPPPTA